LRQYHNSDLETHIIPAKTNSKIVPVFNSIFLESIAFNRYDIPKSPRQRVIKLKRFSREKRGMQVYE